jgi:FtsZ-interacting cell division protein ZipA
MKMKTALSLVAAAAVALLSHGVFAQDKTRAEVKEETKAAVKKGETKAGEANPTPVEKHKSVRNRAERKAETAAAEKAGAIKAGENQPSAEKTGGKSSTARADVKAETKKAVKEGTTPAAGEGGPKK